VPALRDRVEDIPLLARHFIERHCRELGKKTMTLSPAALDALKAYPWPGNVRELQNCLERAAILADGDTLHPQQFNLDVPDMSRAENPLATLDLSGSLADATNRAVAEVERQVIRRALDEHNGDVARAADALQIGFKVLVAKRRVLGM
jgi:DNA-binding NtrC family response regulator